MVSECFCNLFRLSGVDFLVGLNFLHYVCCILLSLSVFDFLVGSNFLKHATLENCIAAQPRGGTRTLFQKQSLVSKKKSKFF